jgi:hypothetical protein
MKFAILWLILVSLLVQFRRRRLHGMARLQEIPLSFQPPHMEDKYLVTLNSQVLNEEQQKSAVLS